MTSRPQRVILSSTAAAALLLSGVTAGAQAETAITSSKFVPPPPSAMTVPGSYIVTLEPGALPPSATANSSAAAVVSEDAKSLGADVNAVFDSMDSFSGTFDNKQLNELMKNPAVKLVEPDYVRTASGIVYKTTDGTAKDGRSLWAWLKDLFGVGGDEKPATDKPASADSAQDVTTGAQDDRTVGAAQTGATWGLDRVDQRDANLDGQYNPGGTGAGVHVYVIDTGINPNHQEFTGRVGQGYDAYSNDNDPEDCAGHGTHVAGTTSGTTYGVAKSSIVHAIRVLGCDGRGSTTSVARGMDWVAKNAQKPAVANMSLGGPGNSSDDRGVRAMTAAGVTTVVAAGNESTDACRKSPAREPQAITVASSARGDSFSSFSNYGRCVDLIAPGSRITSAWWTSNTAKSTISGTSMASPHVAGIAALYLSKNPSATPDQVTAAILNSSTNVSINAPSGTPRKMAYAKFDGTDTNPVKPNPGNPTDPVKPNPGNPTDPVKPNPGNPTDPVKPNPGNPTDPVKPNPGNPTDPVNPNPNPGKPIGPVNPNPQPGKDPIVIPGGERSPECGWVTKGEQVGPNQLKQMQEITLWMKDRMIGCTQAANGAQIDLYLQRKMGQDRWETVGKSTDFEGGFDQLVVDAPPGTYRFVAHGVGNGGNFRFGYSRQ